MSILDEISAEVGQMTDEQLAEAAAKIQGRRERAKAAMTPERIQKAKDREAKRRKLNSEILKAAKAKGLVPGAAAETPATPAE